MFIVYEGKDQLVPINEFSMLLVLQALVSLCITTLAQFDANREKASGPRTRQWTPFWLPEVRGSVTHTELV